jgi:hypothetical protein
MKFMVGDKVRVIIPQWHGNREGEVNHACSIHAIYIIGCRAVVNFLGLFKTKPSIAKPLQVPGISPPPQFSIGDIVMLRDINPYKGSLSSKNTYSVLRFIPPDHLCVQSDTGDNSWYSARYFTLVRQSPLTAADEYEEIMKIQDSLDLAEFQGHKDHRD